MKSVKVKNSKKVNINRGMIGLFFEDINYAADGGIYCEMIENYNFEALEASGDWNDYHTTYDGLYGWEPYPQDESGAMLETLNIEGVSKNNPNYLSFTSSETQKGFSNKAYDGIYLKKGHSYKISCYMRGKLEYRGGVKAVIDVWGDIVQTVYIAQSVTDKWVKYQVEFVAAEDVDGGTFAIILTDMGRVEFDFISLKPLDAVCGIFRRDLAEKLKELKPGFLRFPGGCIVEGNTIKNRYQWKLSVGSLEERKNNWNRWAVHGNNKENNFLGEYSHYNQTLGLGYFEYFLLCEYLNCEPLPVANVGLACQYQSTELVELNTDEFNGYIQDVLDLIEFANGTKETKWGALRCEMGHSEPFNLKMIGIGNEQWETEQVHFFERYEAFQKAIQEKYPEMLLIGSAGPDVTSQHYTDAWSFYQKKAEVLGEEISKFVYAVDEHYYQKPEWMLENAGFYDNYPRNVKVFAGEYATHVVPGSFNNPSSNNLYAALTEAAFMTGIERNADVVILASYAPLFARMGYTQWSPDMIWFDGKTSYETPSYFVQQFYSLYTGKYTVDIQVDDGIYGTASYDNENNKLYLKMVNVTEEDIDIDLKLENFTGKISDGGTVLAEEIVLTGEDSSQWNSIDEPNKIKPAKTNIAIADKYVLRKNSFTVLVI